MKLRFEHLQTERLRLRRPSIEDASNVFEYSSDPEVVKFLTFPREKSVDDSARFLASLQLPIDDGLEAHWAIELAEDRTMIGMIGVRPNHGLNVGYALHRTHWGNSYVPEALKAVIQWGFSHDNVSRIWATCDAENARSSKAMRKAGMTDEGLLQKWEVHPNVSAEPRDSLILSICR